MAVSGSMAQMRGILDLFSNGFEEGHSFRKIALQILGFA
jgi:hypothetical protein